MTLVQVLSSLLFTSARPLSTTEMAQAVRKGLERPGAEGAGFGCPEEGEVTAALGELEAQLASTGLMLQEVAGGWRLVTRPEMEPWAGMVGPDAPRASRLSQPALETLAIIAYRQPISRAEIEAVRGVAVGGVLETLVERGVVRVAGRADVPGRPLLYETTEQFLENFGLPGLMALPNADELRRAPLPEPPAADSPHQEEFPEVAGEPAMEPAGSTTP